MKHTRLISFAIAVTAVPLFAEKLTEEDRIELLRGLTSEYATAKVALPRSRKALIVKPNGTYDKTEWWNATKENGPAARVGDSVQVTKILIEDDRIVLEINNGLRAKKKWYDHVEVGMGGSTSPVNRDQGTNAPGGTSIALLLDKSLPIVKSADVKKMLAPVLDFEKHSATEQYIETLSPEMKKAVADKRAVVGMDRDQVIMAMGIPRRKVRETKDGVDLEDWIYGEPPGRITFVTLANSKVVKVKETYAGLGGTTSAPSDQSTP
jgi:hypothetical protein